MFRGPMTVADIDEHVFKFFNYNGAQCENAIQRIAVAENARKFQKRWLPYGLGMIAFSGYNLSRFGVLSSSGRIGAISGLAIGTFMTVVSVTTKV